MLIYALQTYSYRKPMKAAPHALADGGRSTASSAPRRCSTCLDCVVQYDSSGFTSALLTTCTTLRILCAKIPFPAWCCRSRWWRNCAGSTLCSLRSWRGG